MAKTLVRKVVDYPIWRTVVQTSLDLDHGIARYGLMPFLAWPPPWSPLAWTRQWRCQVSPANARPPQPLPNPPPPPLSSVTPPRHRQRPRRPLPSTPRRAARHCRRQMSTPPCRPPSRATPCCPVPAPPSWRALRREDNRNAAPASPPELGDAPRGTVAAAAACQPLPPRRAVSPLPWPPLSSCSS